MKFLGSYQELLETELDLSNILSKQNKSEKEGDVQSEGQSDEEVELTG